MSSMDLYKYHANPVALAGYDDRLRVPALLLNVIEPLHWSYGVNSKDEAQRMANLKQSYDLIMKNVDLLKQDPAVAAEVGKFYRTMNSEVYGGFAKNKFLWPRGGEVERRIAREAPDVMLDYIIHCIRKETPEYYPELMRAKSPLRIYNYLERMQNFHGKDHIKKTQPKFWQHALAVLATDAEWALSWALHYGGRIPELEPVILGISEEYWEDTLRHSFEGDDDYGIAPIYPSAWAFYLNQCLTGVQARAAVAAHGGRTE